VTIENLIERRDTYDPKLRVVRPVGDSARTASERMPDVQSPGPVRMSPHVRRELRPRQLLGVQETATLVDLIMAPASSTSTTGHHTMSREPRLLERGTRQTPMDFQPTLHKTQAFPAVTSDEGEARSRLSAADEHKP